MWRTAVWIGQSAARQAALPLHEAFALRGGYPSTQAGWLHGRLSEG
jgi:hypothetical protein